MFTRPILLCTVLTVLTCTPRARKPSIRKKSSQEIISMIAQGQMKTFEGQLLKNGLDEQALKDWQNNVASPMLSYVSTQRTDAETQKAVAQLRESLDFITFSIDFFHKDYPNIAGINQHIKELYDERAQLQAIHDQSFDALTAKLQAQKQETWMQEAPTLISNILTAEQKQFFEQYRTASKQGTQPVPEQQLQTLLKTSGVAKTGNKFKDKKDILALLENLDRYAYLLKERYTRPVTHKQDKIRSADKAANQLRMIYGNTIEEDQAIVNATDTTSVILYKLSGTYIEVLNHIIRELREMQ